MADAVWKGSRAKLNGLLARLPAMLAGDEPDPTGEVEKMYARIGVEALRIISEAFAIKASRGRDDASQEWKELSEMTLQMRRKRRKLLNIEDSSGDLILIETQRLQKSLMPPSSGDSGIIGAVTDQVFEVLENGVRVGTEVEYANRHHLGMKSDLGYDVPKRRLWPEWKDWPEIWRDRLRNEIVVALRRMLEELLSHEMDD